MKEKDIRESYSTQFGYFMLALKCYLKLLESEKKINEKTLEFIIKDLDRISNIFADANINIEED